MNHDVEDEFTSMGKLKCIGILRKKGIDYKGKDVAELRKLARAASSG